MMFTADTPIKTVFSDPAFAGFGRLLFPSDSWYCSGDTLGTLYLAWYSHIDPRDTVAIVNDLKQRAFCRAQCRRLSLCGSHARQLSACPCAFPAPSSCNTPDTASMPGIIRPPSPVWGSEME